MKRNKNAQGTCVFKLPPFLLQHHSHHVHRQHDLAMELLHLPGQAHSLDDGPHPAQPTAYSEIHMGGRKRI